jgi:protein phosphatase
MHQSVRIAGMQLTGKGSGIGTTLTCLRNLGNCCEIGHVGDSKLYWINQEGIFELSQDHSVSYRPKAAKVISSFPQKIQSERTYLKRYLGQNGEFKPFIVNFRPAKSDFILICSDGISGAIATAEMKAIIEVSESRAHAIKAFIASAETRGGSDNQTAILVSCI